MPGEDGPLNNSNDDPNKVARDREIRTRTIAAAASGGEPDLAPMPALDEGPAMREATINGVKVKVHVPTIRRSDHVMRFGVESRLPKGTLVRKDGTPTEGDEEPFGVIGDIELPDVGRLVSRVIPFDVVEPDSQQALGKAVRAKKAA